MARTKALLVGITGAWAAVGAYLGGCSSTTTVITPGDGGVGADGSRPDTGAITHPADSGGGGGDDGGGGPGDDGGGGGCTLTVTVSADQACQACAQSNCCAQIEACFNDPGCLAFEKCFSGCVAEDLEAGSPDGASTFDGGGCIQDCANNSSQAALDKHNAWLPQCVATQCKTQCGF
jgi:hypothetical protein